MSDATPTPLVIGILYPAAWYGDRDGFAAEVRALEALDPRIEVLVEGYDEPTELRSARGRGDHDQLRAQAPVLSDAQRAVLARAEVALAIDLPFDIATLAPRLRWVQSVGAGTEQLPSAGLVEAGIRLTSNGGSNAAAIAEFVMSRILQVAKHLRALDEIQAAGGWVPLYGDQIAGRTLGLIGYGSINQAVAARARAFGLQVVVTRRSVPTEPDPDVDQVFTTDRLADMLAISDLVVAATPETPETIGMMGADQFAAMRPGAFFANVGRGSLVDEGALAAALHAGTIGAAALDVTSTEPLPAGNPLWGAPNLYLSAHCSTSPKALFPTVHRVFRANLQRYMAGEPLAHEVQLARGY